MFHGTLGILEQNLGAVVAFSSRPAKLDAESALPHQEDPITHPSSFGVDDDEIAIAAAPPPIQASKQPKSSAGLFGGGDDDGSDDDDEKPL